ncbi:MAG: hypothetical protein WAW06_07390, partial [bacterium]
MTTRFALAAASVLALVLGLSVPGYAGNNEGHKIGVHIKSHPTSCIQGYPSFGTCGNITSTYASCGDVDVMPVFFDLTEYLVVEVGLKWPDEWGSMSWVRCKGDLSIGDIASSGDGTAVSWTICQQTWSVAPGFGWITALTPGLIHAVTNPATGDYGVVDCDFSRGPSYDYPLFEPSAAGVCGAIGDDPCNPKGGHESTWGEIKT